MLDSKNHNASLNAISTSLCTSKITNHVKNHNSKITNHSKITIYIECPLLFLPPTTCLRLLLTCAQREGFPDSDIFTRFGKYKKEDCCQSPNLKTTQKETDWGISNAILWKKKISLQKEFQRLTFKAIQKGILVSKLEKSVERVITSKFKNNVKCEGLVYISVAILGKRRKFWRTSYKDLSL